jgi:hypothetical protein
MKTAEGEKITGTLFVSPALYFWLREEAVHNEHRPEIVLATLHAILAGRFEPCAHGHREGTNVLKNLRIRTLEKVLREIETAEIVVYGNEPIRKTKKGRF